MLDGRFVVGLLLHECLQVLPLFQLHLQGVAAVTQVGHIENGHQCVEDFIKLPDVVVPFVCFLCRQMSGFDGWGSVLQRHEICNKLFTLFSKGFHPGICQCCIQRRFAQFAILLLDVLAKCCCLCRSLQDFRFL